MPTGCGIVVRTVVSAPSASVEFDSVGIDRVQSVLTPSASEVPGEVE